VLRLRLLPSGDDGDWNGKKLRERTGNGAETQLYSCAWWFGNGLGLQVERPNDRIPIEICKVCGGNADETSCHTSIQTSNALLFHDPGYGVPCSVVVLVVSGIGRVVRLRNSGFRGFLDLHLESGFDTVYSESGNLVTLV